MAVTSFAMAFQRLADSAPTQAAVVCDGVETSRQQLESAATRRANQWRKIGVKRGNTIAIALPNGVAFLECALAAWKLGAVPMPLSHQLPENEEREIIELAAPSLLIGAPQTRYPDRACIADAAIEEGDGPFAPLPDKISPHAHAIASGGSSGRSKVIVDGQPGRFDTEAAHYGMGPDARVLIPGPLFHTGPFLNARECLLRGGLVVLMSRFEPEQALRLIDEHRVQWVNLVPTMLHRMWRVPDDIKRGCDLSSLERVVSSGAPCADWLMRAWIDWIGPDRMHEAYGGTERIGGTSISGREWLERPGSVGRPTGGRKVRIVGEDGRELSPGEIGEVFFLPPGGQGSTYTYLGATANSTDDGWETLGDLGKLDEDGFLYLVDRRTDMIITGGENVYPAEVEGAIDAHPSVGSSCVIGLPDDDLGQRIHAIVQADESIESELRAHLADHLIRYKTPRSFEFVTEPLRNDAGKVRRSKLRADRLAEGGG
jgi:bile acid-coenzyme A ligase